MTHRAFFSLFALALLPLFSRAETTPQVIHLWENGAPGFEALKDEPEQAKDWWVRNVNNPSITVFLPPKEKANGCAVIVAPGGGFRELVFDAEGKQAAQFLNTLGVTVFALKYRLPNADHSPYTLAHVDQDARRALRLVRSRATEFNIDPTRVGMLGFSAGGALIMRVAFDSGAGNPSAIDPIDRLNAHPNFQLLVYPGGDLPKEIPANLGPTFLVCANDDDYGCDRVTLALFEQLRGAKVSVEAFFIAEGKHAFNMGDRSHFTAVKGWPQRMADWLGDRGLLTPSAQK